MASFVALHSARTRPKFLNFQSIIGKKYNLLRNGYLGRVGDEICTGHPNPPKETRISGGISIPLLGGMLLTVDFRILFHRFQFVQKGLVTDLKDLCGLTTVPTRLRQHTLNCLALCLHRRSFANFQ